MNCLEGQIDDLGTCGDGMSGEEGVGSSGIDVAADVLSDASRDGQRDGRDGDTEPRPVLTDDALDKGQVGEADDPEDAEEAALHRHGDERQAVERADRREEQLTLGRRGGHHFESR